MRAGDSRLYRIAEPIRPDAVVERIDPIAAGNRRRTAVVRFVDADPVVIQRCTDPAVTRVEATLLDAIDGRTSVPVPTPLGSGTIDGDGWLATPYLPGDDLHESFTGLAPAARRRVARSFGRYLGELHDAFRFDACGPLTVADGEHVVDASGNPTVAVASSVDVGGLGDSRSTDHSDAGSVDDSDGESTGDGDDNTDTGWGWLTAFVRASLARLPSEFDAVSADIAAVLEEPERAPTPAPRLFPWDFRPGNALVADGRVTGVLDWEGPLAAGPALSVAKTEYLVADWYVPSEAAALREAFRAGYESERAWPHVRPAHRVAAVVSSAVDSRGGVTNPGYPPVARAEAVRFHLRTLQGLL
jgi:aminoglycoside phosphotransferase (APT) family kinase protein